VAGDGFSIFNTHAMGQPEVERFYTVASTTYNKGDLVTINAVSGVIGLATLCQPTDKPTHIFQAIELPANQSAPSAPAVGQALGKQFVSTANCEMALCLPIQGSRVKLRNFLIGDAVPNMNGAPCTNASTTSAVVVTLAGGANADYTNGTLLIVETGEQRLITSSTYAAGNHTLNLNAPLRTAPTSANTAIAVPFCKGLMGVKLSNGSFPWQCIDTRVAGKSGGQIKIEDVVLGTNIQTFIGGPLIAGDAKGPYVVVSVPALS
jgi:hypothetical protein